MVLRLWYIVELLDVDRLIKFIKYEVDMKVYVCLRNLRDCEYILVKVLSFVFDGSYFFLVICIFKIVFGCMNCVLYYV